MITIKKVKLTDFGSAKEIKYKFDRPGLNIIQGKNGAGKTTIFNGLMWVIYGVTIKKGASVHPWPELINKDYEGVRGSVDIIKDGVPIEIIRTSEYKGKVKGRRMKSGIMIIEKGVINEKLRNKSDAQKHILNLLGYSPELFKNSVLFGQRLKRLMEEDNTSKKKIMEEAFEVSFLAKAKEVIESKLKDLLPQKNEAEARVESIKSLIEANTDNLSQLKNILEKFNDNKTSQIRAVVKEMKEWKAKMKKNKPLMLKLPDIQEQLSKLNLPNLKVLRDEEFSLDMQINGRNGDIEKLQQTIEGLKISYSDPKKICDYCGNNLPKEKVKAYKEKIKASINKYKVEQSALTKEVESKKERYQEVTSQLASLKEKEEKKKRLENKLEELEKAKNQYLLSRGNYIIRKKFKAKLEESKPEVDPEDIENLEMKITHLHDNLNEASGKLTKVIKELEINQWLLKDPLSNGGLKSFIIESMIGYVNRELNRLKHLTGFKVTLSVNLQSAYKDIKIRVFKVESEVPYEDLSGGQQQLVDVSIAFAMNKIVENSKPINILLLDEVFESLDEENVEVVGRILQDKSVNKSIHLITHKKEFNPINSYRTQVIMENGITRIDSKMSQN